MRTLLNPLMTLNKFEKLFIEPGEHKLTLLPGRYDTVKRGGGGAGGESDSDGVKYGGAGGKGEITADTFIITEPTEVTVCVGNGGLIFSAGGNGGEKGDNTDAPRYAGAGGGGGYPSYINVNSTYYSADGGGGGGGAGGSDNAPSRYSDGASGGGGGGYYKLVSGEIISVPGQKGGKGGVYTQSGSHTSAQPGVTGNITDFSTVSSGRGGRGNNSASSWKAGGAAASGGGASGGGGGAGLGNETYSHGGGGGGGAGGSLDAGGGQAGVGTTTEGSVATDGSNHHTAPTDTTTENAQYGVVGNYGIGGATNTNGTAGFVLIRRVAWA